MNALGHELPTPEHAYAATRSCVTVESVQQTSCALTRCGYAVKFCPLPPLLQASAFEIKQLLPGACCLCRPDAALTRVTADTRTGPNAKSVGYRISTVSSGPVMACLLGRITQPLSHSQLHAASDQHRRRNQSGGTLHLRIESACCCRRLRFLVQPSTKLPPMSSDIMDAHMLPI